MLYQEFLVTEAPEDRDAGDASIGGSLDIDIAITHVNGLILPYPQGTEGSEDGIGSRFLADAFGLGLTDGHLDSIREEMMTEFLGGSHHLITDDSDMTAFRAKGCQSFRDVIVRSRSVKRMLHIVLSKSGIGFIELWIVSTLRHSTFH